MTPEEAKAKALAKARALAIAQQLIAESGRTTGADRAAMARAGTLTMQPGSAERAAAADQIAQDQMTLAQVPPVLAGVTKFNQGIPFLGQYTDELTGLISPQAGQLQRDVQGAMDRQYPVLSTGLQVAGGIAAAAPVAAVAGPGIASSIPGGLATRAAIAGAAGGVGGAVEGAVSGYGAGQGASRGPMAAQGAMIGGGLGAILGGLAPVAGAGLKWLIESGKGRDVSVVARTLGIDAKAAKVVRDALEYNDPQAAADALQRAGKGAMLADAGPAAATTLDAAMSASPKALAVARGAIEDRVSAIGAKLTSLLDTALGPAEGIKSASRGIAQRTAQLRRAAYDAAYGAPIDYAGAGKAIEEVLARVPPKMLGAAVNEANDAMRVAGVKNKQIMAAIGQNGEVVFQEMPNVQQVDYIKRALGDLAQKETDAVTGRITDAGRRANGLASDLRDALSSAVPQYGTAVKLGGDKIAEERAFDLGRTALLPGTTRETVTAGLGNASTEAAAAAKRGLRTYIDETLANVKAAFTDPSVDTRQAAKLVRDLSSPAARTKIEAIVGKPRAAVIFRALDEAAAAFETRAAVATNSKTAPRQAAMAAMDSVMAPGAVVRYVAQGAPVRGILQGAGEAITGLTPEILNSLKQEQWAQIARALTTIRGPEAKLALQTVQAAMAGQPVKSADAARLSRVIAGSLALGGYQSGSQALRPQ